MMRHDEALLWEYAARELPSEDARLVQHHLTECPDCQEKLTDVRTARGALAAAKGMDFSFSYAKADETIAKLVEKGSARPTLSRPWVLALSGGLVAAGLALVAYGVWSKGPVMAEPVPVVAEVAPAVPVPVTPSVEKASGLMVIGAQTRALVGGAQLASGDVLRTDAKGEAMLKLPEGTRLKLASSSQLSLTRTQVDDVTLSLDRGRVAVAASHAKRKGFVVHSNGLMVTVVGTTFAVTSGRDGVEIAVGEGRVSVDPPVGLPMFVNAGQKVRYDARWRSTKSSLTKAEKKELAGLTEPAPPPPPPMPPPEPIVRPRAEAAVVPSAGGRVDELPELPKAPEPVAVAPAPAPAPVQAPAAAVAPPPALVATNMEVSGIPLLSMPVEAVKPPPPAFNEWPSEKPVTPSKAAKLSDDGIPKDHEAIFLTRADDGFAQGKCAGFLIGLEELAMDPSRGPRAEKARIMRARCFMSLMKTKEAENEYRRYVRDYPNGAFMDEAREVMGGN